MANGLIVIFTTLVEQVTLRVHPYIVLHRIPSIAPILIGLTLIYTGLYLRRQKRTAWIVAIGVYGLYFCLGLLRLLAFGHISSLPSYLLRDLFVPAIVIAALVISRGDYEVKSDVRSFAVSLRYACIVLLVALLYGVIGFSLLDKKDFGHTISLVEAMHRTIDQFGLTTGHNLVPHSRRARFFIDSLSDISTIAAAYVFISLFQPLRARFSNQSVNRELMEAIMVSSGATSEDFFKLWPHDKLYFFDGRQTAGLAYTVRHGVALVIGDPVGNHTAFQSLLSSFDELCRTNDWAVAYIHTEPTYNERYKRHGFSLQKIGEEAVVDLETFQTETKHNKYFRQINNRFTKLGYSCEVLMPPHNAKVLNRLSHISEAWLTLPGREERGFMMGYFDRNYMQACALVVLKDAKGTIRGFINQVPTFDTAEANFDLLRQDQDAPGNSNDFMLMAYIDYTHSLGFKRLNLGLCPLSGLDSHDNEERSVIISNALQFAYSNGDRFYSFSGLKRFKAKYEPEWQGRYVAYRGGIRGFTKVLNALNRAMHVPSHYLRLTR
jgi:phosphatidylglycerol lysyltransferase